MTNTNEWQTLNFGAFKIKTPRGWEIVEKQGIDSYYGGLTNGKDSLWFDYGGYGVDLGGDETIVHKFATDTINGLYAQVTIPQEEGNGYISVHVPRVSEKNQFTIWGKDIGETTTILKMYKSLVFKNSDTALNPPLTDDKFFLLHATGKAMFHQKCASCHAIHKAMTGPPLHNVVNQRSADWIYRFITDSSSVASDEALKSVRRQYAYHCLQFPSLTKQDVELIVDYIKSR